MKELTFQAASDVYRDTATNTTPEAVESNEDLYNRGNHISL
jgi:hypothetical protein